MKNNNACRTDKRIFNDGRSVTESEDDMQYQKYQKKKKGYQSRI